MTPTFERFVTFYNDYVTSKPGKTLEDAVYKFAYALGNPEIRAHFGMHLSRDITAGRELLNVIKDTSDKSNCIKVVTNDGRESFGTFEALNPAATPEIVERLFDFNTIFVDETAVVEAAPGLYTYVVASGSNGEPRLFMIKNVTLHEIGSKHQNIIYRVSDPSIPEGTRVRNIHYAGELMITATGPSSRMIRFNFFSGTYMKDPMRTMGPQAALQLWGPEVKALMESFAARLPGAPTMDIDFTNQDFLKHVGLIEVPRYVILLYMFAGMSLMLYDKLEDCNRKTPGVQPVVVSDINDPLIRVTPPEGTALSSAAAGAPGLVRTRSNKIVPAQPVRPA
jgi:hypothetical protein